MAPSTPSAKLTLSCPLFGAAFDPQNPNFLVVGGGGGEGRSGVGNRIKLLDTSSRDEITEAVDIELSRDEDSVTSLAATHSPDRSVIALAGINSSMAEQKRNNNQHLRSFKIGYPRKSTEADPVKYSVTDEKGPKKTAPLSQASIFRTKGAESGADTYQRVLRLSPWRDTESTRVGVIATGFAPSGEIVFFKATSTPTESNVVGRIRLDSGEEAEDVDITDLEPGKFRAAYTNGVDVFTCQVSSNAKSNVAPDVSCVYSAPLPAKGRGKTKIRTLRFLSPSTLLLLQNAPDRGGCELLLLRLQKSGDKASGKISQRRRLHKTMKIGLGLDVCNLGTNPENQEQSIIAVSGSDLSIEILTIEYDLRRKDGYAKLQPYTTLRDVHPFSMTKICFSTFIPPQHPVTPDVGPQTAKLASVSMGNTVVVHTLPLSPFPPPSRTPRYVLNRPGSETWDTFYFGFVALCSLLLTCILLQAFAEVRGVTPPYLGSVDWLPENVRQAVARPYMFEQPLHRTNYLNDILPDQQPGPATSTVATDQDQQPHPTKLPDQSLLSLLRAHREAGTISVASDTEATPPSLIVRSANPDTDVDADSTILIETADTASPEIKAHLIPWEELDSEQRAAWIQRLVETGHWALEESESILNGVLFGEFAGFVGERVGRSLH